MTEVLHNHVILELLVILLFPESNNFLLLYNLRQYLFFFISYILVNVKKNNIKSISKKLDSIELNIFVSRQMIVTMNNE